MSQAPDQILTVAEMRDAEAALVAQGVGVDELMSLAGHGAADYVWRMAMHRPVTVLAGPGNNGGDGYVIAETLRARGGRVRVIAAEEPRTEAALHAASLYHGAVVRPGEGDLPHGEVLVDCLFGSGLARGLGTEHLALLTALAASHPVRIAVDVPSGVESDTGALLSEGLPDYRLTLALGAWKRAHGLMPALAKMGALRLIDIGVKPVNGAGRMLRRPGAIELPPADAHKYTRGMLLVAVGSMPGAAVLAARAATGAGAGYVKLVAERPVAAPPDLVVAPDYALEDERISALLAGPGLGRDAAGEARLVKILRAALERSRALVLDADALSLLRPKMLIGRAGVLSEHLGPAVATPHEGELATLESAFGLKAEKRSKIDRARALAEKSGLVVVAKGPDTIVAAPDGRWLASPRASSWLSTAGSGDVLAGCIASRLACGQGAFAAAAQGVWLQGEAARLAGVAFTAGELVTKVAAALAECL